MLVKCKSYLYPTLCACSVQKVNLVLKYQIFLLWIGHGQVRLRHTPPAPILQIRKEDNTSHDKIIMPLLYYLFTHPSFLNTCTNWLI